MPLTKEWTTFMTFPVDFFTLFTDKIIGSQTYWIHSFKSRNFTRLVELVELESMNLQDRIPDKNIQRRVHWTLVDQWKAFCYSPWVIQNYCDRRSECGKTTPLWNNIALHQIPSTFTKWHCSQTEALTLFAICFVCNFTSHY